MLIHSQSCDKAIEWTWLCFTCLTLDKYTVKESESTRINRSTIVHLDNRNKTYLHSHEMCLDFPGTKEVRQNICVWSCFESILQMIFSLHG